MGLAILCRGSGAVEVSLTIIRGRVRFCANAGRELVLRLRAFAGVAKSVVVKVGSFFAKPDMGGHVTGRIVPHTAWDEVPGPDCVELETVISHGTMIDAGGGTRFQYCANSLRTWD